MAQRTAIVIDLVINGLQNVEKLGQLILAAVSSPKIRAGFQVLQQAMLGVSAGAAKATDTFKRLMVAIAMISQNPAFITFAKKVAVLLKIISNELNKTNQGVKSNADYWKKLSMALGIVSILLRSLAHLIKDVGLGLMRISQSTFGFFKSVSSAGGDIQAKLSELQGLLGMVTQTNPQFESLANEIVRVGKESSLTISQVAGLANELARAGFGAEDIQKSIASVVQLSEAAGISAEQAATIAANVKTMFNLQASELARVNDVLTQTANASTTSVQSLGESFTYVGPLASSFGFSVEEISAALGVLANAGQKGCYDAETEVLTKGGWVRWDRVTGDETFATVNQKTNELEYHPALRNIKYKHTGKMYKVDLQSVDLLVTPNHNMYVQLRGDDEYRLIKAEDVFEETFKYKTRVSYSGTRKDKFVLPGVPVFMGNRSETRSPVEIDMDDWVSFMGAYLSEGCVSEDDKGNYRIFISQYESSKGYEKFKEVIGRLPFAFKYDGKRFVCRDYQLFQHLKTYGKASQKFVPEEFFNLSKEQINLFLEFYRLGDGTKKEKHGRFVMTTVSPMMEQDLARLGVLAGYTVKTKSRQPRTSVMKDGRQVKGKHTQFDISFTSHQRYSNPVNNPLEVKRQSTFSGESWVDFDGFVYCVEVPNNTLIIRRNGKVIICGNSVAGAGLQQMFSQLIAHSDKVDAALAAHGKSFQDVNPEIHSVIEIMQVFQDVNLDTAQIINIFSERARKTFLALQSQGVETLKAFEKLNKESRGIAESVAKVRMDNLPGDVLKLKSAFEALQFTVFEAMQERLRELVQWVTELINKISVWIENNKELITYLTDLGIELGIVIGALGAIVFAVGSANIALSTFATACATALGGATLLGDYIVDLGVFLKTNFVTALTTAKSALVSFTASCYAGATSLFTFQGAAIAVDKTLKKIAAMWASIVAVLAAPVTIGLIAAVSVLTAVFYGFFHNWTKIKDAFVKSFSGMAGGFIDGFKSGFGDVYEMFLGPMLSQFGDVVVYLIEQVALLFGGGSGSAWENIGYITGTLLAGLLSIIQMITNGLVALIAIVVKVVNVFLSLITLDFSPITDFIKWLFGIKSSADAASSSVRYLGKTIAEWKTEMSKAIDASNTLVKSTLQVLDSVDEMGAKLEKGGSMVSRIFQLQPNELNELLKTIDEIAKAGGELSTRGVQQEEGKLDEQLAKLKAERAALEAKFNETTLTGIERTGPDGKQEAAGVRQAKAQLDKLISDVEKAKAKLQDIGKNFELIDIVIGSGGYEKFQNQMKDVEEIIEEYTKELAKNKAEVERIESSSVGGSEFATEDIKQEKLKEAQAILESTMAEREKYLKKFGLMSQAANKEIFDQIFDLSGVPIADRARVLAENLLKLEKKTGDMAKATEEWKKRLEEVEKLYQKIDEFLLNARAKLASAGLDPQSREEFDFNFSTDRARDEIHAMINEMETLRDQANAMGDIGAAMRADAKAQELFDIHGEMEAQAKLDLANIQAKHDKDRQSSLLDMELELAKVRKDKAKEIALTQQKFDEETAKLREQFLIRDSAGNVTGERAGRADFERLRNEKLAVALKNVNDSYADKAPIDRTREMADIQNESYQILLKKVQTTKDLFMLERALLKIQEMQQAAALKASRRAIQSESLAEKIRQKRDQAAAMGMDTSKLDLDLKRATERAGIMRGFSDLKNKQSGIGTSDVNALTAATAAMDATSKAVMDKIGAKMLVISGALVGMSSKFAESAELWIDSFVSAWENSSDKIESTVLGTFERIKLSLETGGLNIPNPEATLPAVTGTPAASAAGASVINNNFQVTAIDPMEAGKKMARLIDQSTRDM